MLISFAFIRCEPYERRQELYTIDDVVIIQPDSAVVKIVHYVVWAEYVKYTVEYLDTTRKDIIYETEIIGYYEF